MHPSQLTALSAFTHCTSILDLNIYILTDRPFHNMIQPCIMYFKIYERNTKLTG